MVTNKHQTEKELFECLIHEFAHAIEDQSKNRIYADGDLAREFLAKRTVLYNMLKNDYKISKNDFLNINFSQNFDDFINKTVGYNNIGLLTSGMFLSPYGCTSLREYFANCFEHYFIESPQAVQKLAPIAYKKIKAVLTKKDF
jgi:Mlc titration factor MtfA (ptsG expression regulator)